MVYDINKAIRILEGNYKNSVLRHNSELLTVNELIAMLKSREPEYPMRRQGKRGWFWYCPKCDTILNDMARPKYCDRCGQAVKWE